MTTADRPRVATPRRDGDPVADPSGLRLVHHVLLRDADRLTDLAERLAAGTVATGPRHAAAVAGRVRDWTACVHRHHRTEDALLWPVLLGSAGRHVDLSELEDDHAALEPMLARVERAADGFGAHRDEDTATALAVELVEVRRALTEHVAEEEAVVVPLVLRHVSVRDWTDVDRRLRGGVPDVRHPRERGRARWSAPVSRLVSSALGARSRRRDRTVFGGGGGAGGG